jgi:3-dehydroquinate dehydratase/shikimate dehydrogenase
VVEHLDNSDALTQQTGACNTIVRGKDGRLFGFNTDVYGIAAALEPRIPLNGARVLVLGAGGAARAAVFGLKAKGAEVSILNRTPATAQVLAKQSGAKTVKRSELPKLTFDVIFNATPVGMGSDKHTPLEENELNTLWVFDSVYNPIETRLLKMAQAKGLGSISGTEMFVHQAARQFEIWTGKPAPIDGMRQVLLRQLGAVGTDSAPIPTVVPPKAKAVAANAATIVDIEASAAPVSEVAAAKTPEAKAEAKSVPAKAAETKNGTKEKPAAKGPAVKAAAVKAAAPVKAAPVKTSVKVAAKAPAKAVVKAKPVVKAVAKPAVKKVAKQVAKKKK